MDNLDYMRGDALASLMEAALRQQLTVEKAAADLRKAQQAFEKAAARMPEMVAAQVAQDLDTHVKNAARGAFAQFGEANAAAQRAAEAFRQAEKRAAWTVAWRTLTGVGLVLIFAAALAWYIMPSSQELRERRAELEELQSEIAHIKASGIDKMLSKCGRKKRPCAKLDLSEINSAYGPQNEWRILADD